MPHAANFGGHRANRSSPLIQPATMTSPSNGSSEAASARAAARGTLWSFGLKIVSFIATQWTLRTLDPVAFGKASIQLELMLSTTLFCAREGFRLALTKPNSDFQVAFLSIPVGTLISILACTIHWFFASSSDDVDYRMAGVLYCLASWVEAWGEPCVLWSLRNIQVSIKAKAEGMATLVKTLSLVGLLPLLPDYPISAFGLSQLLYAVTYTACLYYSTSLPPWNKSLFSYESATIYLVFVFTIQGVFKHVLTEGDRIVLASLADHYHQGVYAMGSAYGGMAARLLLQPLEENGRLLWSRHAQNSQSYVVLTHLVLHVGLLFSCIATNYTTVLLKLIGGTWGDNPEAATVLSAFCVYTAFLAWNGMTEAFVYAVASSGIDVTTLGAAHVVVGGLFMGVAPMFVSKYGTVGLVAANCLCMGLRACYAVYFASKYFSQFDRDSNVYATARRLIRDMFPPPTVLIAYGMAFVAARASLLRMNDYETESKDVGGITKEWLLLAAQHVAVGLASALVVAGCTFVFDRDFRLSLRSMFREKQE